MASQSFGCEWMSSCRAKIKNERKNSFVAEILIATKNHSKRKKQKQKKYLKSNTKFILKALNVFTQHILGWSMLTTENCFMFLDFWYCCGRFECNLFHEFCLGYQIGGSTQTPFKRTISSIISRSSNEYYNPLVYLQVHTCIYT